VGELVLQWQLEIFSRGRRELFQNEFLAYQWRGSKKKKDYESEERTCFHDGLNRDESSS
jgi:hypothetical protein